MIRICMYAQSASVLHMAMGIESVEPTHWCTYFQGYGRFPTQDSGNINRESGRIVDSHLKSIMLIYNI